MRDITKIAIDLLQEAFDEKTKCYEQGEAGCECSVCPHDALCNKFNEAIGTIAHCLPSPQHPTPQPKTPHIQY